VRRVEEVLDEVLVDRLLANEHREHLVPEELLEDLAWDLERGHERAIRAERPPGHEELDVRVEEETREVPRAETVKSLVSVAKHEIPELPPPVTVDLHVYDALLGVEVA